MKIFVDEMFRNISRWLRIFGVSNFYLKGFKDKEIINLVRNNDGVLITSDKKLCLSLRRNCVFLKPSSLERELAFLSISLGISYSLNPSLCPICGDKLIVVSYSPPDVPPKVRKFVKKFYFCSSCKKSFWKGRHWEKIQKTYNRVMKIIEGSARNNKS